MYIMCMVVKFKGKIVNPDPCYFQYYSCVLYPPPPSVRSDLGNQNQSVARSGRSGLQIRPDPGNPKSCLTLTLLASIMTNTSKHDYIYKYYNLEGIAKY